MGTWIIVVDSSVLIAILLNEEDAAQYAQKLIDADQLFISAVSVVEASMVIEYVFVIRTAT